MFLSGHPGFILTSKIEGDFRRVGLTPKNDNRNFNYFHTLSAPTEEKLRTMNKIEEYKKRAGTSGIQGQLYETKLISLIYFRLKHDENVDQFSLATNRDDIGAFDDICFKAKLKGINKPITVFIQAKHRENDKLLTFNSKTELAKYFDSYLDIRRAFDPSSKDMIFGRKFDETECFFVMYTTAKDDPSNKAYEGSFADILDELIGTGGSCTQPSYRNEDLDFLCKIVMKEQITTLVEQIAKFICDGSDSEMSMNNDLMLRYHVILALNVLHVSEIQPEGHRIANFRQDLFTTNEEFLVLIKNMLCLEVLKKRISEETVEESLLTKFINEPSEITTLSKLIGSVLTYKKGKLEFVSKSTTDDLKRQLDKANVPESAVYEAAELAAKEYLLSLKLKVPALFGNKDLAIRGKPERIEKRLKYLTSKIIEIFEQSKCNNIVTIDESLEDGFLQLNGGIASAVGNILVFDETSKLLKFTDNCESLGNIAKTWYETLKSKIENLHEYKLDVKVKKFPKLSFDRVEYDVTLVRDFYDKLLFYTNQADQSSVAELLKGEIEDHPCNDVTSFRVRSDVIFLKYHDEIQKLWMTPKVGTYLTKKSKIYEDAVTSAMSETLMGILNIMYKFKNKDYIFNEDAIKRLESHEQNLRTVIATGSCVLTVAKVKQYLGNEKKDHVVLDLDDIFKLPLKSQNTLCKELTNATKDKILIIVCNNFQESGNSRKKLENIAKTTVNKQIIIITNKISVEIITKYFPKASNILNDDKIVFTDMTVESQKKLLATSKLKFQGEDLSLDKIVDDENAKLICEDLLNQIIDNETIVIGKTVVDYNYNKAKPFYVDRRVSRIKKREHDVFDDVKDKVLKTLYDLEDDVVLITASPGMGKSTLLSHLSLKTKEIDPKVWIVRINLLEHARIFSKWQDDKTVISNLESLKFMCQAALSEESNESYKERDEVLIELEESSNGTVTLKKCSGGTSIEFQLKMFFDFYNRGKLIFLFDGFDEIFPHYERETLLLLKSVRSYSRKHRAWITSRSFNYVKSILEQEFGLSYEIEHFTCPEQDIYFNTFWKSKIQFKNLNMEQMRNVHDFLHFMQDLLPNERYRLFSLLELNPYFKVYLNFLDFIKLESVVNGIDITYHGYNNFLARFEINKCTCEANDLTAPPLHLYLLAECFHNKIKDVEEGDKDWDIDVTGFIFYEYYFETKIKKIRFQEKNKIDIYNPDNKMTYERERADSVAKHKKLGAYAIFYPHVEVFEEAVLKEIEETINELSNAREKTGLIRGVANNIPLFVHRSFAEYFAVEYICDLLKNDNKIQKKLWNFILKVMFVKCGMNVFDIFNTKIKMDETLISVVERSKDYIDTLLSEEICDIKGDSFTWLDQYRTDRITFSMFSSLCDSIDMNDDTYDFEQFFSSMFHRASQDCDSFSLMELSNKLHLGSVNKNAKRNQKTNYMFLRIRGSVLFYQGLQAPRMRNLLKKKTAQNLVPSKR